MIVKDNKKINPIISDKEAKSTKVQLQTTDGKYFGDVSYDAYKAVEGGTLDSYKAKNDAEKNIIAEYRKHPGITLKSQDGTEFGKISYDAYRAFTNNTIEGYTPHSETEKKAISDFKVYAENKAKEERINSNPTFARYGIDPADFDYDDLIKWAAEHNHTMRVDGSMRTYFTPNYKGGFLGIGGKKLSTDQEDADMEVLYQLANNNIRYDLAQTDMGAFMSSIVGFADGLSFGGISALSDWSTEYQYEKAGLNPDNLVKPSDVYAKTVNEHKIANIGGDIVGSVVTLGALGKGVSAATKGVKWISSSPQWVQSAINSGITFAVAGGTETAFDGGSLKDVLVSTGTNFVGGAVGGAVSSKVGAIGEKILFNKGLQHKIIPEMIRNGFSSAAFAGGKVASTYFLYPEEYRPTAEEMAKDIGVAFAFGAISSGINTMKASAQNKKYLDDLYQKMASDYENMAKANISSKSDISGIRKFAKNVVGYSNAMEAYLTGKEFNATIDGNTYTFTPNKIRLVGQDKYVNSILSELQTIRNNANAVLNGVGTPTTDIATTTPTSSGATAPTIAPTLPSGSTPTGDAHTPVPPIVSVPPVNSAVTSGTPAAAPSASAIDTSSPVTPASASGELGEILGAGEITKFTPESASGEIKRLENILIAKGADDVSRQEIIGAALEIEKALVGSDKTIRSVFNNVSKITSGAVTEIKNKAGVSGAYWKLFGENFKALPSGSVTDNVELITEYATAYTEALKSGNPEKYNAAVVSADGKDLAAELPQTIMQNVIPANTQNAGEYRLVATQIKNIISDVDVQLASERAEIYGDETSTVESGVAKADVVEPVSEDTKPNTVKFTLNGDFYNVYGADAELVTEKLGIKNSPTELNGKTVPYIGVSPDVLRVVTQELSKLGITVSVNTETPTVTSTNEQNMPVSTENVPVNESVSSTAVDTAEGEILSLKHTKNVYSLFKGALRIVVGKDIITDGFVVLPLTDESLAGVKKVIGDSAPIQENPNFDMKKFYHADNDVIIQGNPKVGEATAGNKTVKAYTFKIADAFYSCQQKFIDAFNNGKNVIKANKSNNIPWTVHNENGELVALFLGLRANVTEENYNQMLTVADIKSAEQQKKAKQSFNPSEVKTIVKGSGIPRVFEMDGSKYVTEGHFALRTDDAGIAQLNGTVIPYHSMPDGMQTIPSDAVKKLLDSSYSVDVGELTLYTPESEKDAKTPPYYAFVADGIAHQYSKKFVDALKKRSTSMKLTSGGTLNSTLIVGYDADGNVTGFVLPVYANGNSYIDKDGNKIPFATNDNLKNLVKDSKDVSVTAAPSVTEDVESGIKSDKTVTETPESVTEPTESVIKKADSVTETPENEKITVGMSDDARAELLNKKSVNVVSFDAEKTKALDDVDFDALQKTFTKYAKPIIEKVANDFGIINKTYFNPDIELDFEYSKGSLKESINKQHTMYGDFIKMLSVFSDVISNAVGVETHEDKYKGTIREDTTLKQMYVLASALRDETGIIPVKLEVKEFNEKANKLYLSVVLTKKESRYLHGNLGQNQLNTATPAFTISIADLVGIVNPSEGDFLKYFPDSMLDSEQIEGKNKALAKDAERIEKLSEDKKRSLATAENANALSSTPETTNSTASTDIVPQDNDTVNKESKVYDVAYFEKLGSDIRKGESVSLKDVRTAVDAILLNHGEAIKAELSQLKNDELKKRISIYDRGRITKKAEMVDSIYTDMLSSLYYALSGKDTITYIYDGTGFEAQQSKMLFDISRELTEETFSKRLAENAEKYKKQLAAKEEKLSKIKNPQTLEDYAYKKRYFGLSDEETIQYENLYAEERRKAREDKKAAKTTKDTSGADAFFANTDNYTIEKTTHTKTGDDVWVVRPTSRLETEQWKQLNEQMKALGGSYWRGNQGWNFKKDPTAALSSTEETETATVKGSTNAEKLRAVAEGMQKAIDDKFRDRLTNTAKRAREAASAEAEGERLKRLQDTINNIADALENGENTLLDKIDSKAQVETLMSMLRTGRRNRISETLPDITYDERLQEQDKPYSNDDAKYAEYPLTKLHENAITEYIRAAEGKTGYKQITDRLKKSLKSVKNGYVTVDAQMFADIDKIVQNLSTYRADFWNDGVAERKRLARMGIENVVELRAYLREFIKFLPGKDADAERQRNIKAKERQLANAKIEGFFPTPKAIVEKMLDEADIKPGEKVLEPSAGKGNIADAIRENHPDNALDVVEWNASLNELLTEKGHNVVGVDFLQHSGEYDKIIMNPPFEKGQDIGHIRHAYSLLNDGGRVVCIMSEGPFYRSDKKATEFREWLDSLGGVSEKLPEGSFKASERSTGVNTRLVVIDKVASDTKPTKTKSGVKSSRDLASDKKSSVDAIKEKYKDKTDVLFISEKNDTISIDNMVVKKEYRNQGIGTDILNDIIKYADSVKKTITLTPTTEFGTKERLKKWYKSHGFVENKGRHTDFLIRDTMYRPSSSDTVRSSKDTAAESSRADRWSTDRVDNGKENKSAVSVSEIIEQISTEFGIPISTGKVTDSEASGIYKEKPETIRTRISNNLPTISHELGHHLDKKYNLNESGSVDSIRAIVSEEFLDQYPDDAVNGELVAEFVRRYLKNSNEANRLCPEFYNDFVRTLSKEDLAAVNRVAKQVNEYLSYDIDKRYESSVISAKKAKKMQKLPFAERWKNLYTGWVDKFHPLKQITDYVSEIKGSVLSGIKNAYVLATNSLNAHTIANYQVLEGFRDLNGNFVDDAKSLIECIGMVNSKDITTLDLYLKLKHALEVIGKGKRVFADEVLEDTDNIKKKIAEIEKEHPEMVEAANNLYEFQYNMLKHFAVPSGIMTMEQVEYLHHEYPCYVPFYRFIKNKKGGMFAKSSFVNQGSPIMRQTGSGLDTLSHLESIIRNVEKIVKASTRNQTAAVLGSYADNVDGIGQFIEKVAPDMLPHTIDITTLKENFAKRLQEVVKSGDDFFAISGLMDEVFGDDVTDFTPVANESKKIISVMRGGERSYYQIHDDALFSAVAELSPQQVNGWIRVNNMIMQPMKLLITQNNPIFAATNALRDFGTAYKLSEIKNPLTFVVQYAKALGGIITNSEDYKKYKAMGGGHSSELSANIENISKTLRRVAEKDMGKARRLAYSIFRHPVDTVASINDAVESIPRFMEFERTLKENGDLQKAIFNASDITTNFKRSGSSNTAKFVNSSIMFNNAAIQGLDKMFRTITAKDPKKRYATLTKWLLHALIMGILGYLYNKEVDEEGYKNLSSYKKNNFYNFAIGDGKFISLPKPRENALLDTITERTIEYLFGDNEEAFYDFGSYLGSQLLPPMLPDTLHPVDAVHSVGGSTIFGGLLDVGFNKDFKGTPIEGAYDKYTPSNERYTDSTTKLAYGLGQTKLARDLDMSPKKIDHLISSYTGIVGQVNKALLPMNESRKDTSFGLRNKFVSDSNYSTDVLNRMYENQEKAEKAFNYSGSVDDAVEYEKNSVITSYISGMNKAVKALPEEEQRNGRAYLLKNLNSWNYEDTASQSNMLSSLADSTVSKDCIFSELPSSTLEWTVDKQKYVYQMTPEEYHKYISDYLTVIENARRHYGGDSVESYEAAKDAAKDYMSDYKKNVLKEQYLSKATAKTE